MRFGESAILVEDHTDGTVSLVSHTLECPLATHPDQQAVTWSVLSENSRLPTLEPMDNLIARYYGAEALFTSQAFKLSMYSPLKVARRAYG